MEWLIQRGPHVELERNVPVAQAMKEANEITILIHGYHAPDTTVATYFEGLIAHLKDINKYRYPIIVFDWPSEARYWVELSNNERIFIAQQGASNPALSWEIGAYFMDVVKAKSVGVDALMALIEVLSVDRPDRRFNIISHSMGCYVVSEAIRKHPHAFARVKTVIWLAPDIENDVLEDRAFAKGLSNVEKLHIFYSGNDNVLKRLSGLIHVSHMLGSHGPANTSALPYNVLTHDLTNELGENGVHSRYLERDSVAGPAIARALNAATP